MQFNSLVFWCFFALVLGLYRVLGHRWQNRLLLFASYVFYGYWDWRFLSLIFVSTLIDYIVGQSLAYQREPARRRLLLTLSVVANLSFLGFFKYDDFFARELNAVLTAIGFNDALPILHVVLPVGISFYTFQSMSYTIDVYREKIKPTTDLSTLRFTCHSSRSWSPDRSSDRVICSDRSLFPGYSRPPRPMKAFTWSYLGSSRRLLLPTTAQRSPMTCSPCRRSS